MPCEDVSPVVSRTTRQDHISSDGTVPLLKWPEPNSFNYVRFSNPVGKFKI